MTHLKLAVSIQSQPILTEQRPAADVVSSSPGDTHGLVRSGSKKPLSLANCSRQMGRKRVSETTTKTSLCARQQATGSKRDAVHLANA